MLQVVATRNTEIKRTFLRFVISPIFYPPEKKCLFFAFVHYRTSLILWPFRGSSKKPDFSCPHPWIATKHINERIPDFSKISRKKLADDFTVNLLVQKPPEFGEIFGLSSLILTGWVKIGYHSGLLIMDLIQILQ
jgi:hypothetical protein